MSSVSKTPGPRVVPFSTSSLLDEFPYLRRRGEKDDLEVRLSFGTHRQPAKVVHGHVVSDLEAELVAVKGDRISCGIATLDLA